jgi:hypothetical protein
MTTPTPSKPRRKRPTLTEELEKAHGMIDALLTRRQTDPAASVEFTRNAKGATQVAVKVTDKPDAAYETALALYERACQRFPTPEGYVTSDEPPRDL